MAVSTDESDVPGIRTGALRKIHSPASTPAETTRAAPWRSGPENPACAMPTRARKRATAWPRKTPAC